MFGIVGQWSYRGLVTQEVPHVAVVIEAPDLGGVVLAGGHQVHVIPGHSRHQGGVAWECLSERVIESMCKIVKFDEGI